MFVAALGLTMAFVVFWIAYEIAVAIPVDENDVPSPLAIPVKVRLTKPPV